MIRYLFCVLLFILPPTHFFTLRRKVLKIIGVFIGNNVCFCGHGFIYGRGALYIGDGTWVSPGVLIRTHVDASIKIGRNCDIGPNVELITGGHSIGPALRRAGHGTALPIEIEDGCWIGARTLILGGVRIGAGSIVAAGSVVTQNVPENVLVAGIPARIKKELDK
jgi:maltose O-acetyltransferase